jgi:hypothetical protein
MKKEFSLTLRTFVYLAVTILVIGIASTFTGFLLYNYAKTANDTASAVIGFSGNVIGGLIGGVVAYIVAAVQIKSTIAHDSNKGISTSYAQLRLIRAELINNNSIIATFKEDFSNGEKLTLLSNLSKSNWERCSGSLGIEVSDDTISKMQSCYTKLEAYTKSTNPISISVSDDILSSISNALNLIQSDINKMI